MCRQSEVVIPAQENRPVTPQAWGTFVAANLVVVGVRACGVHRVFAGGGDVRAEERELVEALAARQTVACKQPARN